MKNEIFKVSGLAKVTIRVPSVSPSEMVGEKPFELPTWASTES